MGTEILQPRDCFIQRIKAPPAAFSQRRTYANCTNYYYNNQAATSGSSRKPVVVVVVEAVSVSRRSSADDSRMTQTSGSAMEKVAILRRGQSLDSSSMVITKNDVYAGSAFAVSPSPSALPFPSFPTKKQPTAAFDDSATRDLRRMLLLE